MKNKESCNANPRLSFQEEKSTPKVRSSKESKTLSKRQISYIRHYMTGAISEFFLLKRFGYKYLVEVPKDLYQEVKDSLFSLRERISRDKAAWYKSKGTYYTRRPVYEDNKRVF
jgi:hypothetical protein